MYNYCNLLKKGHNRMKTLQMVFQKHICLTDSLTKIYIKTGEGPWKLPTGQWATLPDAAPRPGDRDRRIREGATGSKAWHWKAASRAWDASQHEDEARTRNSNLPPPPRKGRDQVPNPV